MVPASPAAAAVAALETRLMALAAVGSCACGARFREAGQGFCSGSSEIFVWGLTLLTAYMVCHWLRGSIL